MVNARRVYFEVETGYTNDGSETLRLYPSVYVRVTCYPDEIWRLSHENSPTNVRFTKQGVLWPALDGGKPFYIPPNTEVAYSPWLMHRRVDLWGQTGRSLFNSCAESAIW